MSDEDAARETVSVPELRPDAERAALKDELWGMGVPDDLAEGWIARWDATAAAAGIAPDDPAYWRLGAAWIHGNRPAD